MAANRSVKSSRHPFRAAPIRNRAARSGDLEALTQMLTSDVRVVTDGGGKVAAALNVLEGADRAARSRPRELPA
jgi:hypothetical protein